MVRTLATACALLFLGYSPMLAQSAGNVVHFGEDIVVSAEQSVKDAGCFLCSVRVDGAARGLIVVAGNVYLNGAVHGDVVVLGGHVTLTGKSSIGKNLVVFGGRLYRDPSATIGRNRVLVVSPVVFLPIILVLGAMIAVPIFLLRYLFRLG